MEKNHYIGIWTNYLVRIFMQNIFKPWHPSEDAYFTWVYSCLSTIFSTKFQHLKSEIHLPRKLL